MTEAAISAALDILLPQAGLAGPWTLHALLGGGNNRVYRVETEQRSVLLKVYFRHPQDTRDRWAAEVAFTRFAWEQGLRQVPEPLAADASTGCAIYEFISGHKLLPGEMSTSAVEQAVAFCAALNQARIVPQAAQLPTAAEACFSIDEHLHCVERRVRRLETLPQHTEVEREAHAFVCQALTPSWERWKKRLAVITTVEDAQILAPERRCLSPSDFGFHNALQTREGQLRFFDFEYAGWDDPAKLVCDFFCQPAIPVSLEYLPLFLGPFPGIRRRVEMLLPVYQLKWITIMLNDFLPVDEARRRFAQPEKDDSRRRIEQLAKAKRTLQEMP